METVQSLYSSAPWWTKWAVAGGLCTLALLYRGYTSRRRQCRCLARMVGKTVVITGGNCGIGKATALDLAGRGARVILACRNLEAGRAAAFDISSKTGNADVRARKLDLASFASVRDFCQGIKDEETRIDVLINNAGVFHHPFAKSEDGIEMHMAVNHFGHFLLTALLLDQVKESAPSRIVVVSSALLKRGRLDFQDLNQEKDYNKARAYATSKLANALFARELSRRLEGSGVDVHCLHPGMVMTKLSRHVLSTPARLILQTIAMLLGVKSPTEGCQTVVYCSCEESLQGESGGYYGNYQREPWPQPALDDDAAKKLWELSEKMTGTTIP